MKDNDKIKQAFEKIGPPPELEERTRAAIYAAKDPIGKERTNGSKATAIAKNNSIKLPLFFAAAILIIAIALPLVGFFGFNSNGYEPNGLRSFSSISEVKRYVSARKSILQDNWFGSSANFGQGVDYAPTAEADGTSTTTGTEHSTTNNQVKGVAESDIAHTDGNYIYSLSYYSLSVVDIRNDKFECVSTLTFDNFYPVEMFLYSEENKLIVIGNCFEPTEYYDGGCISDVSPDVYWHATGVAVKVFDTNAIASGAGNAPTREIKFNNSYISSSRMIDGKMFLILNSYNYYNSPDDIWLPKYYDSKRSGDIELNASDIFATPDNGRDYNFTVVAGINFKENGDAKVQAFFGSTQRLYASKTAFYITYDRYEKESFFGYFRFNYSGLGIMRFEIDNISLKYKGLGKTNGYLINQFAMDEYTYESGAYAGQTFFRLATTHGNESRVIVFDKDMKQVGGVDGLGKGERIYSVRFNGTTAVVVTFYQIDPLYVLDISDPKAPKVKSELKIPGVSDYLHFTEIKDGFVFAVGRGSKNNSSSLDGIKVSLFDISGEETVETEYYYIGSNSSSDATYNHKAIMHFLPSSGNEEIFAFPVNTYESRNQYGYYFYNNSSALYYYSVDSSGDMTQTVFGFHAEEDLLKTVTKDYEEYYYSYYRDTIKRSVIAGDYIYLIGNSGIERFERSNLPANENVRGKIITTNDDYWVR